MQSSSFLAVLAVLYTVGYIKWRIDFTGCKNIFIHSLQLKSYLPKLNLFYTRCTSVSMVRAWSDTKLFPNLKKQLHVHCDLFLCILSLIQACVSSMTASGFISWNSQPPVNFCLWQVYRSVISQWDRKWWHLIDRRRQDDIIWSKRGHHTRNWLNSCYLVYCIWYKRTILFCNPACAIKSNSIWNTIIKMYYKHQHYYLIKESTKHHIDSGDLSISSIKL